ncbi:MAG: SusC/RagA family TonB-linked outer membrane protein [Candidatus Azobacteroides sp.]|nr:SusC/RagA family TonB-linked outer membrane protein [Candidatus Azobacteroides sp.]
MRLNKNIKINILSFFLCFTVLPAVSFAQESDSTEVVSISKERINIGYGEIDEETLSSAVSQIEANTIKRNAVTTLEEALNGTLSGLYSIKDSGHKFGARNFEFYVRGKATVAGATPLILVDDVEANINLLDFNEVESVTVLKDASALAIYGMRGANGVILIKTKRGAEMKNTITVDFRLGIQKPVTWKKSLNAYDYTTLYNEAAVNDGGVGIYNPDVYKPAYSSEAYDRNYIYPDENYGDQFLRNHSISQQYNFSARGGNKTAQYFSMVSYTKQDGLFDLPKGVTGLHQNSYERYNFRSNIDVDLGEGFFMSADVLAAFDYNRSPWMDSDSDTNVSSSSLIDLILNTPANAFPVVNKDGSLGGTSVYPDNPQGILKRGMRTDENKLLAAKARLSKDLSFITSGLKVYLMYHFENYNTSYKGKYKEFAIYDYNPETDSYTKYGTDDTMTTTVGTSAGGGASTYYRRMNFFSGLEYHRTFDKHSVDGMVFFNRINESEKGDVPDYKYQGVAGRVLYGYDSRYFAELSASYQGSNSYASGNRYGFFPALGLGWILSNENFLKDNEFVNFLKLRASGGINGNDKTLGNRFAYRQSWYAGSGYGFGSPNAESTGTYEGALASPDATWEKSYKANAGIDFKTFRNELGLALDFFYEKRTDIMVEQGNNVPSMIGIELPFVSEGKIKNRGIEASFQYHKQLGQVGLMLGGNFLYAKNKIIDLKEPSYEYSWMYRKGNSINTIYGFASDGIYNSREEIINAPSSVYTHLKPGDIRYINQNPGDDDIINQLDKVAIGNDFPEIIYGINIGLTYRDFDFSCYGKGSALSSSFIIPSQFSEYARDNRWQHAGSNGNYPLLSLSDKHNTQTSDFWKQSGNFFRINSIELGYTLPKDLVRKAFLSEVRIYVNANNVATISSERENRDPEAPNAGFTEYPLLRSFVFGVSVKL